ncbi:uncharacterized protein LOC122509697 [Leptopilina heterotoma]|uniref:uncharacterized protein LOC122509697 n=1 Tax=Leptopilina heterotoma TaxID=63436 RepID=UPI001CA8A3F7|nr:uncharacterized protein LOC122509697 [Leptopilina heterotoma]
MERYNPYSYNYDSSDQLLRNNAYDNRQLTSELNIDKRKLEEQIFNENKKRRENTWTASASTSKEYNEDVNYLENDRQHLSSNTCDKLSTKQIKTNEFDKIEYVPHRLLSLAYQIELSALCLLRAHMFRNPPKSAIFKTTKIGQFNNIIQCFNGDYYCIRVQHVDTYYAKKCINHKALFSAKDASLSNYLSEFAVELLCYLEKPTDAPKYLIFYTNCALDLTHDGNKLKLQDVDNPEEGIQLEHLTSETDPDLIRLFKTGFDNDCEFYRFGKNGKNLSTLVKFSNEVKNRIGMNRLHEEGMKRKFFDRVVFAVNQPTVEELVHVVRSECRRSNENYSEFRREILEQLVIEEEYEDKEKKHAGSLLNTIYSFDVFNCCLHEMFMWDNIVELRFNERFNANSIVMNCRNSSLCLIPLEVNFEKFDRCEFEKQIKFFHIKKHLKFFIRSFDPGLDYFVIFTNASMEVVRDLILGEESTRLEFSRLDVSQERYSMFQHSFFDRNNIYQFSPVETEKLLDFLTLSDSFDYHKFSPLNPIDVKRIFIDRVVFAVRQYSSDEMFKGLEEIVDMDSRVPYDLKGLQKIALRYLKSYDYGPMTKGVMAQVADDLKNPPVQNRYFCEEIKFAESAMELLDVPEFPEFVTFLTRGEGTVYLDTLKRNGIDIFRMASMIRGSQTKAKNVFLELYNLWFDQEGNKKRFLKLFEGQGFGVENMSDMLRNAGNTCRFTLVNFFNLLFDDYGCPSIYLRSLQMEGVNLSQISSILSGSKEKSVKKFKDLYKFWFEPDGQKTESLRNLEKYGINLTIICSVISKPHNFPNLYNLWFHKSGKMTMFLQTLCDAGLSLTQICSVIKGPEGDPMVAFRLLYDLWFDKRGRKTLYSQTLEKERISLTVVLDILVETGCQVRKVFKKLFDRWFSASGAKTPVLRNLEAKGKTLAGICRLLSGAGCLAVEKFRALSSSLESVDSPIDRLLTNLACKEEVKTELVAEYPKYREFQEHQDYQECQDFQEHQDYQDYQECQNYQEYRDYQQYQESSSSEVMRGNRKDFYQTYHDHQKASSSNVRPSINEVMGGHQKASSSNIRTSINEVMGGYQEASSSNIRTPIDEVIRKDFFEAIPDQSTSSSVYNPDYEPNDYEDYADFEETNPIRDDDGEEEESDIEEGYMFKNKSHSKSQLKQKIYSFFELFPTWKKASRYRPQWKRVIKEVLPIINNPQALKSFLQSKLQKKKIDQTEYDDLCTLSSHGPFNAGKLQHLLIGHKKSGKTNLTKKDRFVSIIFPNEKSVQFNELLDFLDRPQGKWYLKTMLGHKIFPQHLAKMLVGCKNVNEVVGQMKELHELWFDKNGERNFCLKTLSYEKRNIRYLFVILGNSGNNAAEAFKNLYNLWFDSKGEETRYLATFKENGVTPIDMYMTFEDSGSTSAESIQSFYNQCFDSNGRKTKYLTKLEAEGISLQLTMTILKACGAKTSQVFQEFYHLLFDLRGDKTPRLQHFEKNGITSRMIAKCLIRKGEKVSEYFEHLHNFVFDENSKRYYMRNLEEELSIEEIFGIISGYETDVNVFKELCDLWFDKRGSKSNYLRALEANGVNLKCLAGVLRGTGSTSYVVFNNIFSFLFDKQFNKSKQMFHLEEIIDLRDFFEIVSGANKQVFEVVKSLYQLWFDFQGRKSANILFLEKNNISLQELTPRLGGSGKNVVQKFKKILNLAIRRNFRKHDLLQHFDKKWDDDELGYF